MEFYMKTGSFVFQRVLDSQVCKKVGGGVSPNFNYQPPAINNHMSFPMPAPAVVPQSQNYAQLSISGIGGSNFNGNPNYNVGLNIGVAVNSNVNIIGAVSADSMENTAFSISIGGGW